MLWWIIIIAIIVVFTWNTRSMNKEADRVAAKRIREEQDKL